jgi:hypothetical protein
MKSWQLPFHVPANFHSPDAHVVKPVVPYPKVTAVPNNLNEYGFLGIRQIPHHHQILHGKGLFFGKGLTKC